MTDRLLHFSKEPLGEIVTRIHQDHHFKPFGLWVSVGDGEDSWPAWCRGEDFRLDYLAVCTEITLKPDANVLWLKSCREIDEFTEKYEAELPGCLIDWARVAADHHGLVIAPYQWHRRLHPNTGWYYAWDCASGCIWNADAIAEVRPQQMEAA